MSKIEEMASTAEYNGIDRKSFERGYIQGANDVLKEIEQLVSKFDTYPGYQYNDLYVRLKDKLNGLKGE